MPGKPLSGPHLSWQWVDVPEPTLVVQLLQVGQVTQHSHAVPVRAGATAWVLGQPEHPEVRQVLQVE